jgi:2-polyprenyl-3-methyl-5-hydroxy-6-metoxy-1,4-benzoquinol methylase
MTPNTVTTKQLLNYLKTLDFQSGFLDRLKVYYRPLVCPFAELITLAGTGARVGDVGCGSGQFCLLLSKFAAPASIYGIEISDQLVNNAYQLFNKHSSTPHVFEPFNGISFPDKIKDLDVIFLNDVLHHVPINNQKLFIKNLTGTIHTGARLIVKDINASSPLVYCNKLHDLIFAGEIGNELPVKKTVELLEQNDMQIISVVKKRMYVYPHYTIVAQKK